MNEIILKKAEIALRDNLESARSPATTKQYQRIWRNYVDQHGDHLPADPVQVALYLSQVGIASCPATVRLHASAISAVHTDAGYKSPIEHPGVRKTLSGHARIKRHVPAQASGIDSNIYELLTEVAVCPRVTRGGRMESVDEAHDRGIKDLAIIGLMRDALLRRSECAALTWNDLITEPDGSGRLIIRYSKTDQEGKGSIRYVSAMIVEYIMVYKLVQSSTESMFDLSASQICRRIKALCDQAGLKGKFSGHSPRIGMAIDLARAGVSLPALMEAGRWKSSSMPAHYVRAVEAGSGAVAKWYEN